MKKSAALIIGLIVISVMATFALSLAYLMIRNVSMMTRLSDALIAEEAAMSGMELGLYQYKIASAGSSSSFCKQCNPATAGLPCTDVTCSSLQSMATQIDIQVSYSKSGDLSGNITSNGQFGGVYKKYTATIDANGNITFNF